ncbi:sterol desaturase family protein [Dermacoccus abyssi]|uniref:sterol desaturase family protein n=1 Tax=Dermacoccus abyssi TaxID=322596 RepID=UPI0011C23FEF|nr:hypothetical protein [Dermacoccus abyssi]
MVQQPKAPLVSGHDHPGRVRDRLLRQPQPRVGTRIGAARNPGRFTNSEYLDRNHGSILIVWDKLFGTFEAENAQPVYGLTTNIDTFNPLRIAGHEWADMFADVSSADNWADRWSYLLRGPGWAYDKRKARLAA